MRWILCSFVLLSVCSMTPVMTSAQSTSNARPANAADPTPAQSTAGARPAQTAYSTRVSPSYADFQNEFYKFGAHLGKEDQAETLHIEPGAAPASIYQVNQQAAMISSGREPTPVAEHAPLHIAKAPLPEPNATHPLMQREFTEYSQPLQNNFGPPTSATPFRHTPAHDANPSILRNLTFTDLPYMTGAPASDLISHAGTLVAAERTAERMLSPSFQSSQATYQGYIQGAADAFGTASGGLFEANLSTMQTSLINVANEMAAIPASSPSSLQNTIWMVQQMSKTFFIPLSLLLLAPGAVITQAMGMINFNISSGSDDAVNPFVGILRALVAIFLIPATQLIVSYSIDIGNTLTDAIAGKMTSSAIQQWTNDIASPNAVNHSSNAQVAEMESTMSSTSRAVFGSMNMLLNYALMVLVAYQTVMACYLYLMGPIAAALFAWPSGVGSLFKPIFGNWLNALTSLVLWRFWWCTILLCISTRVSWLKEIGSYSSDGKWEAIVYTAFLVLLACVPFAAFDFKPGEMVDQLFDKAGIKPGSAGAETKPNNPLTGLDLAGIK